MRRKSRSFIALLLSLGLVLASTPIQVIAEELGAKVLLVEDEKGEEDSEQECFDENTFSEIEVGLTEDEEQSEESDENEEAQLPEEERAVGDIACDSEKETISGGTLEVDSTELEMEESSLDEQGESNIVTMSLENSVDRYTVLVLDTSSSTTFSSNGTLIYTANTAVSYVKQAAKTFLNNIAVAGGNNYVAIVSYKSTASVIAEFSTDMTTLINKVSSISASDNNRSIAGGLEAANTLLASVDSKAKKNVVLFTTGMTSAGNYNYSGKYGTQTIGSDWYRTDTGISLYAYANTAITAATKLKDNGATVYTLGLFQTMDNMPAAGKNVVSLFKLTAKDIASSDKEYYEVEDVNDLEFTFGEVADAITKNAGVFYYASGDEEDYTATYYYDDDYFCQAADSYQDSLATMSMCLALSAFASNRTKDYSQKSQNLRYLLDRCGFSEEHFDTNYGYESKPTTDSIGVGASYKQITDDDKTYTLIAVGVRGGGYQAEWASNFTLGTTGTHQGFTKARDDVLSFLKQYIAEQGITGDIKIWITGYSRAAATSNMVAGKLDDGYSLGSKVSLNAQKDVFAYCFECPKGGLLSSGTYQPKYNNIFSIINPSDLVTKVAPTQPSEFGFDRYGVIHVLPSNLSDATYGQIEKDKKGNIVRSSGKVAKMLSFYNQLDSVGTYIVDDFQMKKISVLNILWNQVINWKKNVIVDNTDEKWDQNAFLDELVLKLFSQIKNRSNYVQTYQDDIREICKVVFGTEAEQWEQFKKKLNEYLIEDITTIAACIKRVDVVELTSVIEDDFIKALNAVGITDYNKKDVNQAAGKIATLLLKFGASHPNLTVSLVYNGKSVAAAHFPELCLAWLMSYDKNYTPDGKAAFTAGMYRTVHINCPVDVEVYDSEGKLVAKITDDKAQEVGSSIVTYINDEGEKLVYLPCNEEYSIDLKATDDGTMTYTVNEFSDQLGANNRLVNYMEVEIKKDEEFTGKIPEVTEELSDNPIEGSSVVYSLLSPRGEEIEADNELSGEAAATAVYTVTVESDNPDYGYVTGSDVVALGNFAKVTAVPNEGCEFLGWYQNHKFVSDKPEYRFCVTNDTTLTAKFEAHELDVPVFTWKEDEDDCVAVFHCRKCGKDISVEAIITSQIKKEASFTSNGSMEYTATVTMLGRRYSTPKKTVSIPKIGKQPLTKCTVSMAKKSYTYTGKAIKPSVIVKYKNITIPSSEYTVNYSSNTKAGTAKAVITAKSKSAYISGKSTVSFKIAKKTQSLKMSPTSKSYKLATVKKKAQTLTIKVSKAQGSVSYKSSNTKYVTVSKKGKVTIKKGTPKGKYKITVTAKGNTNYSSGSKTVTITVK